MTFPANLHARGIRRLRALCRLTGYLPLSCFTLEVDHLFVTNEPLIKTRNNFVYRGTFNSTRGSLAVAIKTVNLFAEEAIDAKVILPWFIDQSSDEEVSRQAFHSEICILKTLRHGNIVSLLGVLEGWRSHTFSFVSHWMSNGTLPQYLRKNTFGDRALLVRGLLSRGLLCAPRFR
jgi:serine/threonine protein kinase